MPPNQMVLGSVKLICRNFLEIRLETIHKHITFTWFIRPQEYYQFFTSLGMICLKLRIFMNCLKPHRGDMNIYYQYINKAHQMV
jgi:hypothetical protein